MWDKLEYPPQPFGQCSVCSRHECGDVIEDGVKKQRWLHLPIELDKGGRLVIGYQCVRGMSEDLGVAVRVVEKEIRVEPSDEDIIRIWRELADRTGEHDEIDPITQMSIDNFVESKKEQPKTRQRRASR